MLFIMYNINKQSDSSLASSMEAMACMCLLPTKPGAGQLVLLD